jgi:thioredoxin reductase (NADPH)
VFEGLTAGGVRGGQLMTTTEVENFPGFPEGIAGPDLMDRMRAQAERWGATLLTEDVESADIGGGPPFTVRGSETVARAHALIVATGATAKRLNLPSEHRFWSSGISACAICDGASPLFKGAAVAVVGGGDTAVEEALYLTKYASSVHLLVRSGALRASAALAGRAKAHPRVTIHFHTAVEDAEPDARGSAMGGLRLVDTRSGETRRLAVRGLFYGIGHTPNTAWLGGAVPLGEGGYVATVEGGPGTAVPGVFAAGDVHDAEWRQAITAAGAGCKAALAVERYLAGNGLLPEEEVVGEGEEEAEEKDEEMVAASAPSTPEPEEAAVAVGAAASVAASPAAGRTRTPARKGEPARAAAASSSSSAPSTSTSPATRGEDVDLSALMHKGQVALRRLYHDSPRPLVVLYTAPTCGPCRALKPILHGVAREFEGSIHLVEIDIAADPDIARAAGVSGTPTVQVFKDKARLHSVPGVKAKREYRALVEGVLSGAGAAEAAEAEAQPAGQA